MSISQCPLSLIIDLDNQTFGNQNSGLDELVKSTGNDISEVLETSEKTEIEVLFSNEHIAIYSHYETKTSFFNGHENKETHVYYTISYKNERKIKVLCHVDLSYIDDGIIVIEERPDQYILLNKKGEKLTKEGIFYNYLDFCGYNYTGLIIAYRFPHSDLDTLIDKNGTEASFRDIHGNTNVNLREVIEYNENEKKFYYVGINGEKIYLETN